MTKNNLYIDIHVIQAVPSSNINRDDTGSPKTAIYGGVTRSRVSSQSWKRAMRTFFNQNEELIGQRTKDAIKLLSQQIEKLDPSLNEDAANDRAKELFTAVGIKFDKKTDQTKALLFVSQGQLHKLAEYSLNHDLNNLSKDDKNEIKEIFNKNQSLDLALFGRMVADNPELNVEGSAQVAHAISTHEVVPEFDYFTALDDVQPADNAGAAMLGTIEYNSATLYRYANLNVHELAENIGKAHLMDGVINYVKSFLLSMPTGKQNTFANKTLPSYVMVNVRRDTPVNLVSAFESPIQSKKFDQSHNDGYVGTSVEKLEMEYQAANNWVEKPVKTIVMGNQYTKMEHVVDLDDLLNNLKQALQNESGELNEDIDVRTD